MCGQSSRFGESGSISHKQSEKYSLKKPPDHWLSHKQSVRNTMVRNCLTIGFLTNSL